MGNYTKPSTIKEFNGLSTVRPFDQREGQRVLPKHLRPFPTSLYDDPLYGARGGSISIAVSVARLSTFLSPTWQADLPDGYRIYIVTREYVAKRVMRSGGEAAERPVHTDMLEP